jgi:uncharacterized phiE125 gp8 family phage protein
MGLYLKTQPTFEPVTLGEAKAHLRVTHAEDDTYITHLITVARTHAERYLGGAIPKQTWVWTLDAWPVFPVDVPKPPLVSVVSFSYTDSAGITHDVSASDYTVDTENMPGRIYYEPPAAALADIKGVRIEFEAGYKSADDIPADIRHAILLLVGHWYENREDVAPDRLTIVPRCVDALLNPWRVWPI